MTDPILADVNAEQREAITHGGGPLLVVAGAGSGKTRVITRRVAWLVREGVAPWEVVALTFTNKAAREMRGRVRLLVPDGVGGRDLWVCTFHSFAARILRRFGERLGYTREFSIYDTDDQTQLVKTLLREMEIEEVRPSDVLHAISSVKNGLARPQSRTFWRPDQVSTVMNAYAERLKSSNAMDFDDLLINLEKLLADHGEVREVLRRRCRWTLVDEYQDTNDIQFRILRALVAPDLNVCATGDPDQSIYRWRGATIRNILAFERDFPDARVVTLDRNYRSTRRILEVANAVIRHNRGRYEKELKTAHEGGEPVREIRCLEETEEAAAVCRAAGAWISAGRRAGDIAVFYRVNAQSRVLERQFKDAGMPYRIVGSVEFYKRREVKDLLAYMRVARNPRDDASFWRVFNVPPRKLGRTARDTLGTLALERGEPARLLVRERSLHERFGRGRKAIARLADLLDSLDTLPADDPAGFVEQVIARTRYLDYLGDGTPAAETDRIENVRELVSAAAEYMQREPEGDVDGFLEENALVSDQDTYADEVDCVTLMTVHSAKGLEFPCVVVTGLEEETFPHAFSMESEEEIEEERRLFYVAVTRAERELALTWALHRRRGGVTLPALPSRFLREIPAEHVVVEDRTGGSDPWRRGGVRDAEPDYAVDEPVYVDEPWGGDDGGAGGCPWSEGDRVRHQHFGKGKVHAVRRSAGTFRVTIDFESAGRRELSLEYARLERL